jgi:hypothetical protein
MTASQSLADRKAAALASLRQGRQLVVEVLDDTQLDEIYLASQWGVADAVNHMLGGLSYRDMIERTIREERPRYPAWPTSEESWGKMKADMLRSMDEAIAFVEGLTEEQLARVAICGSDEVPVIQFVEWAAGHYLEHGNQIKNEILPLARKP